MDNSIRDFISSDLDDYIRASKEFYGLDAVLHPAPEEHFRLTFDQCLGGSPYLRGLALLYDGKFAGYGLISITWSNEAGGLVILLEEAYILPKYQGHGLGSAFIAFVESEYAGTAKRFRLEVTHTNLQAIKLYERLGYERFDYLQMVKDL